MPTAAAKSEKLRIEYVELGALKRWPRNPKKHSMQFLGEAFEENGFVEPIIVDEGTGKMVAGHGRLDKLVAMKAAGEKPPERIEVRDGKWWVPVVRGARLRSPAKHVLASNRGVELGGWDDEALGKMLGSLGDDLAGSGFSDDDASRLLALLDAASPSGTGRLAEQFLVPPFSVLDARQGYWQDRKRAWLALGIKSELGRTGGVTWGDSPQVTEPGLNYYRNENKRGGRGGAAFQQTSEREIAMLKRTGDYAAGRKHRRAEARGQR